MNSKSWSKLTPVCCTWKEHENTFQQFCVWKKLRSQNLCLVFLAFSHKHSKFPSHDPILRLCPYSAWLFVCFVFPGGNPQLLFVKYLNAVFCFSYLASLKKYWNITFPRSLTSSSLSKLNISEPRDHMKLPAEMIWNKFKNFLSLNIWPNTITGSFFLKGLFEVKVQRCISILSHSEKW